MELAFRIAGAERVVEGMAVGDASIERLLREWDGEEIVVRHDRPSGAWIVIAIHSTRSGAATGGTRMRPYSSLDAAIEDAMRLSAGMTAKFAVVGFPRGGGKAVIAVPSTLDPAARRALLLRYGTLVHDLRGLFETGPDVGTSPEDMDVIWETGAPYIHARTAATGGAGDSAEPTSHGVFAAVRASCEHALGRSSLEGVRVLIQGTGSVGGRLARLLHEQGAMLSLSDIAGERASQFARELGAVVVPPDAVYDTACDVFAPCALGAILNAETIPRLECRIVAGAANNQLATEQDALRLHERGILYAPDFVANLGGAVGIGGIEVMGWTHEEARERVQSMIGAALRRVFALSEAEGITTLEAAERVAAENAAVQS